LISYKEYKRLKDIEVQFKKSEKILQQKLQISTGAGYKRLLLNITINKTLLFVN
jgi:hypothetical protein